MALDDDIRILSGVRLFEGFTAEQLRLLAFGAEQVTLPNGRRLFREDDEADAAYVVVRGSISLFREDDDERRPVAIAGTGAMIGELALIADTRRLTSAEARADTELLRLSRRTFRRILEEYPDTAAVLLRRIQADFLALIEQIEGLAPRFGE
ncbi:cyclic nucleotide-binding domain-containing protein [Mesorhizobium sp. LHD-90]|uniref:cyclic nucleotide-binding domain-containing protein n=1 Tax=Mesorhizobium sp. LHD-90 TaxID=3071414 RepID=UPI0027E1F135|nr:cyclic nucleotide-binding domain-containing protein [Mesorhizobium sp. LHD-90]MDQ6434016.1 cyclic nucleotide-binding domain-containing protein [Mesorhizobium sp. LHD-90]